MSQEQRDRLETLKRVQDGVMTQRRGAELMGMSERWVRELVGRMEEVGDAVVVHGLSGRSSNRRIDADVERKAMEVLRTPDWQDFGPTLASEQLGRIHGIAVSRETVRKWMVGSGMWKPGRRRQGEVHVWRPRRSGYGELVQWDTSDHDWLEGRGERIQLVAMVDDATSQTWGRFVSRDGTRENMGVLREYLERHGRMVEVYTDRDSMFAVARRSSENERERVQADRVTQIGRALRELGIGWIAAGSPQAKGRVERHFRTDQDRLVKQMRLAKVDTLAGGNQFLESEYWPEWNAKFARPAAGFANLHRPVEGMDLESILSHVEQRVVGNDYTISWGGRLFQIGHGDIVPGMRRQGVRVELRLDGTLWVRHQGRTFAVRECGARPEACTAVPAAPPARKDHNRGGRSHWMDGFFDRPGPALWQAVRDSNGTK